MRRGARRDLLGRALGDDPAAAVPTLGSEIDDPVRGLDDVEVVFDDDDGVASIDQRVQHREQPANIVEVETGGRFVEEVERLPGGAFGELA